MNSSLRHILQGVDKTRFFNQKYDWVFFPSSHFFLGITVLLSLSVFLSIVASMLPQSSDNMPNITIYLSMLLVASVLTVIDSIIIVLLKHYGEVGNSQSNSYFALIISISMVINWTRKANKTCIIVEKKMSILSFV